MPPFTVLDAIPTLIGHQHGHAEPATRTDERLHAIVCPTSANGHQPVEAGHTMGKCNKVIHEVHRNAQICRQAGLYKFCALIGDARAPSSHGAGDCDHSWTSVGRAADILDNMIEAKKAKK